MPELKAPDFLADLYYDLRDRRLLPLIAVVVVAIVAVPFLLGELRSRQPTLPPTGAAALAAASAPERRRADRGRGRQPRASRLPQAFERPRADRPVQAAATPAPALEQRAAAGDRKVLDRIVLVDRPHSANRIDHGRNSKPTAPTATVTSNGSGGTPPPSGGQNEAASAYFTFATRREDPGPRRAPTAARRAIPKWPRVARRRRCQGRRRRSSSSWASTPTREGAAGSSPTKSDRSMANATCLAGARLHLPSCVETSSRWHWLARRRFRLNGDQHRQSGRRSIALEAAEPRPSPRHGPVALPKASVSEALALNSLERGDPTRRLRNPR